MQNFGPKINFGSKIVGTEKFWVQKIGFLQNFGSKKFGFKKNWVQVPAAIMYPAVLCLWLYIIPRVFVNGTSLWLLYRGERHTPPPSPPPPPLSVSINVAFEQKQD